MAPVRAGQGLVVVGVQRSMVGIRVDSDGMTRGGRLRRGDLANKNESVPFIYQRRMPPGFRKIMGHCISVFVLAKASL